MNIAESGENDNKAKWTEMLSESNDRDRDHGNTKNSPTYITDGTGNGASAAAAD